MGDDTATNGPSDHVWRHTQICGDLIARAPRLNAGFQGRQARERVAGQHPVDIKRVDMGANKGLHVRQFESPTLMGGLGPTSAGLQADPA